MEEVGGCLGEGVGRVARVRRVLVGLVYLGEPKVSHLEGDTWHLLTVTHSSSSSDSNSSA
jgi:hypothetical protein